MLEKIYRIGEENLYIYCEIDEYIDKINKWMKMYDLVTNNNYEKYIKIYTNETLYNFNDGKKIIKGKIKHTDLYPLFYNAIANIINDKHNMLSHSAVLCYNNKGILVFGDFGTGKTSLCLEADKLNIKTFSTDQTHLELKNGCLKLKNGSKYMKVRDGNDIIVNQNRKDFEINVIINPVGLCDCGGVKFDLIDDDNYKIKTLFKYFTWHSDIPLFSDDSMLNIDRIKIKEWLMKVDIPLYNVRGDMKEIINKVKEILK